MDELKNKLKTRVRFFYDLQKLRIQSGNRNNPFVKTSVLDDDDKAFFNATSLGLEALEKRTLRDIKKLIKTFPISDWLLGQKGCGPTMTGVIISEINMTLPGEDIKKEMLESDEWSLMNTNGDGPWQILTYKLKEDFNKKKVFLESSDGILIDKCPTVSSLWAYCGLACDPATGKAVKRKKGVKANWNPFLKTKVVHVLGSCLIKANSPWRKLYDHYKHRKTSEGWGESDLHRHNAAIRHMVQLFLADMWAHWRRLEGLPCPEPYAVAKLNLKHGDHANIALHAEILEEIRGGK